MSFSINSFDSNSISTLFSSLNGGKKNSATGGLEGILSDYSTLRTGSYGKLIKSYYKKYPDAAKKATDKNGEEISELKKIKTDASALNEAADVLLKKGKDSIWEKTSVTDENGKTKSEFDRDKIFNALSKFVDSYNSLVDSSQDSKITGVLTQAASMVTTTSTSLSTLAKAGITIDSKNHMHIDEEFLKKKADMGAVKDLFNGTGSYAYSVATKASMIGSYTTARLSDLSGSKAYSKSGSYSMNTSDMLSSLNTKI